MGCGKPQVDVHCPYLLVTIASWMELLIRNIIRLRLYGSFILWLRGRLAVALQHDWGGSSSVRIMVLMGAWCCSVNRRMCLWSGHRKIIYMNPALSQRGCILRLLCNGCCMLSLWILGSGMLLGIRWVWSYRRVML